MAQRSTGGQHTPVTRRREGSKEEEEEEKAVRARSQPLAGSEEPIAERQLAEAIKFLEVDEGSVPEAAKQVFMDEVAPVFEGGRGSPFMLEAIAGEFVLRAGFDPTTAAEKKHGLAHALRTLAGASTRLPAHSLKPFDPAVALITQLGTAVTTEEALQEAVARSWLGKLAPEFWRVELPCVRGPQEHFAEEVMLQLGVARSDAARHRSQIRDALRDGVKSPTTKPPEGAVGLFDGAVAFVQDEKQLGAGAASEATLSTRVEKAKREHLSNDTMNPTFWCDTSVNAYDQESRAMRLMLDLGVQYDVAKEKCPILTEHIRQLATSRLCFADAANVDCGQFTVIVDPAHKASVDGIFSTRHVRVREVNKRFAGTIKETLSTAVKLDDGQGRSTVVLRGESGSGKTFNAIAVATEMQGTCVYVLPSMFDTKLLHAINGFATEAQGGHPTSTERIAMKQALDQLPADKRLDDPKVMRDALTKALVLKCVEAAVPEKYRGRPSATKAGGRCAVLVFDEMGGEEHIVRALCSVCFEDGGLRGEVARLLQLAASQVSVIVTGTGVEAHQHMQPGSHIQMYHLLLAAPRAWDVLKTSVAPSIRAVLEKNGTTPALVDARGMLEGNARLAALFAELAPGSDTATAMMADVPHALIAACLQLAVVAFRKANGLSSLAGGRDVACELVNALCAQTLPSFPSDVAASPNPGGGKWKKRDDNAFWHRLCVQFGLVVDHARRVRNDEDVKALPGFDLLESDRSIAVPRGTVRFVAGSAVSSMAHALLFGAGVLGTGDGFEVLAAEFVAFAALFSSAAVEFDVARVVAMMPRDKSTWQPPRGWSPPVALVAWLQGRGGGTARDASAAHPSRPRREPVWMARCGQQLLTAQTTALEVRERAQTVLSGASVSTPSSDGFSPDAFTALKSQKEAVVVVNGASSPYADVVASVACGGRRPARRLLACQCKFYPRTKLTAADVFKELRKMGHPELVMLWAALEHLGALATEARVAVLTALGDSTKADPYNKDIHFAELLGRTREWRAEWLEQLTKNDVAGITASDLEAAVDADAAAVLTKELAQRAGATPLFVVMVYGRRPAEIDPLPADVALLWAPLATSATDTAESTAREHAVRRLRGFYPVPFPQSVPSVGVAFGVPAASETCES